MAEAKPEEVKVDLYELAKRGVRARETMRALGGTSAQIAAAEDAVFAQHGLKWTVVIEGIQREPDDPLP